MKKRLIACLVCLIAIMFLYGCGSGAYSANEDSSFSQRQVKVYEFDPSKNAELTCVFKDSSPNVPYVNLEQYLDLVYGKDSDFALTGRGNKYTVIGTNKNTGKTGSKLKIDTKKETLKFEEYEDFVPGSKDETMVDYVDMVLVSQKGNPSIAYNLSKYGIDILAQDGQVYLPLSTWSDILSQSLTYSEYIDGDIYLIREGDFSFDDMYDILVKEVSYYDTLTREPDVADYAYRELCFVLENLFGRPERTLSKEFASKLSSNGFDKTLEEGGAIDGIDLKKMKSYLTSTKKVEYAHGLVMLSYLLYDGGHTYISQPFIVRLLNDEHGEMGLAYRELLNQDPSDKAIANDVLALVEPMTAEAFSLNKKRTEGFGAPSKTWEDEYGSLIASIYLFDNTAIFQFDSFCNAVIRTDSGEKPFSEALQFAKDNGCDNFVLDLSTNGGGSDQTMGFILNTIFEEDTSTYFYNVNTGARKEMVFHADKNLDGSIDDKDQSVKYDFHYAVMISDYTFSCGNYTAVLTKAHGIPLLGETSGGGGCLMAMLGLPGESNSYQISAPTALADSNYQSVDAGAAPDYPMSVDPEKETGAPYLYDPEAVIAIVNQHYLSKP